ncbi:hypothetical protein RBEAN4_0373 [Rickettsia bellii str. RML An4]|uniref:Uncharacterized protein n=1 Tax=Rickettsia bellii str. RML An4 TaxID=1359193 RepID=A0A0F3QB48_RICBE|nr:hypothetical protein RBEAN4_0373 [Rickettsia bellii str. RML An4]
MAMSMLLHSSKKALGIIPWLVCGMDTSDVFRSTQAMPRAK